MLCTSRSLLALLLLAVVFVEIRKRWVLVFVNVIWEEGISFEELPHPDWPVGMSIGCFHDC